MRLEIRVQFVARRGKPPIMDGASNAGYAVFFGFSLHFFVAVYTLIDSYLNWQQATDYCNAMFPWQQSRLPMINNNDEQVNVAQLAYES